MTDPATRRVRTRLPRRLRAATLVLPALLIAALVGLDSFFLEPNFPPVVAHLATVAIGVAGVLAFSTAIFARLIVLQERALADAAQLRVLAGALEQKRQQLQAVNAAGLALTSELDREAVLQRVVDEARQVASARYAALGVFDERGVVETFTTSGITQEQRRAIGRLPQGLGLLGLLQREKRAVRVRDLHEHPSSVGFPPNHPPMRSFVGLPILLRGDTIGNLYLTEKQGADEFTMDDEEALQSLAAQAAIAIENARLYDQAERVSVLEERHRIGMDLHDGTMQGLYAIGLLLEDVAERLKDEPERARAQLLRTVDRLNATITDLRGYVLGLRPIRGSDRPLTESLPVLAEQARTNALLDIEVDVSDEAAASLDRPRREAAFLIAADALGNVARHARARSVRLHLFGEDGAVVLEISDDGVGFDYESGTTGHGLRNMRERAFAVGGMLRVETRPGHGARVRLELPTAAEGTE